MITLRQLFTFSVLFCLGLHVHAQSFGTGFNVGFGKMQPRSEFAKEAYESGWTAGCRSFIGADFFNVQMGGGFEMIKLRQNAYSETPFMDSIIKDNSGDPTTCTFLTLGIEAGTPAKFPVRLSVLCEGDVGIYFGKSVYVMRQLRRDPKVHPIHWAAGFTLTGRLSVRLINNDDTAIYLFAEAGFRGHPGQVQKNRFVIGSVGVSVWNFE